MSRSPSWLLAALLAVAIIMGGLTIARQWPRVSLSWRAQQALRQSVGAWTPQQAAVPLSVLGSPDLRVCTTALVAVNRLRPGYWLDDAMHRLVRFISLACEEDAAVVQRYQTEYAAGGRVYAVDALYVGDALTRLGRENEARALQRQVPEVNLRYVELGRIAIERMNDEPKGLAYFDLAQSVESTYRPQKVSMYMYQCLIILRDGERSWGYTPCENFLRAVPGAALPHLLLGRSYLARGNPKLAQEYFRNAIQLDPQMGDAHHWLGKSLLTAGDVVGGKNAFDQGLAQAPTYPWNYLARAELAIAEGDQNLAIRLLCQMMQFPEANAISASKRLLESMDQIEDEVWCDQ